MPSYWRKRSTWWTGETGRQLRQYPPIVREIGDYLMSSPVANVYGLYYLPVAMVANDTGRTAKMVDEAMAALHDLAFAYYDPLTQHVWIREMAREQLAPLPLRTGDWTIKAANRFYKECAPNLFLGAWFDRYAEDLRLDGPRREWRPAQQQALIDCSTTESEGTRPLALVRTGVGTQIKGSPTKNGRIRTEQGARFERFWQAWPDTRRVGKAEARLKWDALNPDDALTDQIIAKVELQKQTAQWLKEGGRYIVHPSRYIDKRRWEDVVVEGHAGLSESTVQAAQAVARFLGRDQS